MFRRSVHALVAATTLSLSCVAAAQSYPVKPVRIIVPAGPGGPDIVARITAAKFTQQMGQTFYVENHGGANGIVGADMVAKAAPDGYTLMVYSSGIVINQFVKLSETVIDPQQARPAFAGSAVVAGMQVYLLLEGLIDHTRDRWNGALVREAWAMQQTGTRHEVDRIWTLLALEMWRREWRVDLP